MTTMRTRVALVAVALGALACDQGLVPLPLCPPGLVGICGKVTFRGALPDSTDLVYVVAYATVPTTQNDLFTFQPQNPPKLQLDSAGRATPQPYALNLPPGTYHWVLAAWKKQGILSPQSADSLLREAGFYRDPIDTSKAGTVVVAGAVAGVDFTVDFTNMHPVSYYFPASRSHP